MNKGEDPGKQDVFAYGWNLLMEPVRDTEEMQGRQGEEGLPNQSQELMQAL